MKPDEATARKMQLDADLMEIRDLDVHVAEAEMLIRLAVATATVVVLIQLFPAFPATWAAVIPTVVVLLRQAAVTWRSGSSNQVRLRIHRRVAVDRRKLEVQMSPVVVVGVVADLADRGSEHNHVTHRDVEPEKMEVPRT